MSGAVVSYTTDPANLGAFDEYVEVPEVFPREINESMEDVRYHYYYINASSPYWYIVLSWRYPDKEAMEQDMAKLEESAEGTYNEDGDRIYIVSGGKYWRGDKEYRYKRLKIFFDLDDQTVYYVASRDSEDHPDHVEDIFPEGYVGGYRDDGR